MAAIAEFYLLPGSLLFELHEATVPRKREITERKLFFSRTRTVVEDDLLPFLKTNATLHSRYEGPGLAFSMLDRLLQTRGFESLFSDQGFAGASTTQTTAAVFDPQGAKELLTRLREHKLDEEDVGAKVREQIGGTDAAAVLQIFSAWRQLQAWLAALDPQRVGVLCIVRELE
jgi:hypothetical protein